MAANDFYLQLDKDKNMRLALMYIKDNYGNRGLIQVINTYGLDYSYDTWTIFGSLLKNGENEFLIHYLDNELESLKNLPDSDNKKLLFESKYDSYMDRINNY